VGDRERIRDAAASRYAAGGEIWPDTDRWNTAKRLAIDTFCRANLGAVADDATVLNAGAGSFSYGWMPPQAINLDRFPGQASQLPNAVAADVENLPFSDDTFDVVICIGSVLNYVSAMEALAELCRVLKPGGRMLLHYETSNSAEHLGTSRWRASAAALPTINNGEDDFIWVYSRAYVERTLRRFGVVVEKQRAFHIASAVLLRIGLSQDVAARASILDRWLAPLSALGDDLILRGRKS
jgi:SAM-dependent methyltransferase